MSTASLFPAQQKTRFMDITRDRYRNMGVRLAKDNLAPPFTLEQLRDHILDALGWDYNGAIICRYCRHPFGLAQAAIDHVIPLERGGGLGLSNLELICAICNAQKGKMLPQEFIDFLNLLEKHLPYARVGILEILQMHSKLLAKLRQAEMLSRAARNGGQVPPKKGKPGKPPLIAKIDEVF
jgi:5-methylcytosine-specific restriction endonuclease McrA